VECDGRVFPKFKIKYRSLLYIKAWDTLLFVKQIKYMFCSTYFPRDILSNYSIRHVLYIYLYIIIIVCKVLTHVFTQAKCYDTLITLLFILINNRYEKCTIFNSHFIPKDRHLISLYLFLKYNLKQMCKQTKTFLINIIF
jgi:hypothetical protein